jgi:hypothetical protein
MKFQPPEIKKTFTLVQHTPMIHFQDHPGATLRHDEFKAKFDKYLCQNVPEAKKYLVPNNSNDKDFFALDYSVSIVKKDTTSSKKIEEGSTGDIRPPMFFANMGKEYIGNEKHRTPLGDVTLEVQSLKKGLLSLIETHLVAFLQQTNFGTRQSKGYGCFMLKDAELNWSGWYQMSGKADWKSTFENIDIFYKILRSGMNGVNGKTSDYYCKPIIFDYTKNILQWEKKTIKQAFFSNPNYIDGLNRQLEKHPESEALRVTHKDTRVIKDLLGFATEESWMNVDFWSNQDKPEKAKITKTVEKSNIARMKSPILFKPVKEGSSYNIYFKCFEIPEEFKKATLNFQSSRNNDLNRKPIILPIKVYDAPNNFFEKLMKHAKDISWNEYFTSNNNKEGDEKKKEVIAIFKSIIKLPIT